MFNETEPELLETTSLPFESINRFIKHSRCEKIITILDCCYSGAAAEKGVDIEKRIEENLEDATSGSGKIILTASTKYQRSKEDLELKHGVFTNYLLEGLKSEKVADEHGHITIDRLYNYAHKKTKDKNPDQEPLMKGTLKGEIVIGKNLKRIKEITYNEKVEKLIEMRSQGLPGGLYNDAIKIIEMEKEDSPLTDIERKIKPFLEDCLNGTLKIELYIKTIERIKKSQQLASSQNLDKKKNIDELSNSAQRLSGEGKQAEAIEKWREVLKLDSENREALERIEESERILKELEKKKKQIDELSILAQSLYNEERYNEAVGKLKEILNLGPKNKTAEDGIKKVKEEINKKQIIELSSNAQKLFENKIYAEAIAKWQDVLDLDSENSKAIEGIDECNRMLDKINSLNNSAQQQYDKGNV